MLKKKLRICKVNEPTLSDRNNEKRQWPLLRYKKQAGLISVALVRDIDFITTYFTTTTLHLEGVSQAYPPKRK